METGIDLMFGEDPIKWVQELPEYQRVVIDELRSSGKSFDVIAQTWINVSAENTFRFTAMKPVDNNANFLENLKKEVRSFLCNDKKYEKERADLNRQEQPIRTYIIGVIAVAIAPHVGMAAPVISPIIAIILVSIGKITLNSWCATR